MEGTKVIKLDTQNTSLVFTVCEGKIEITHYGKKIADAPLVDSEGKFSFKYYWGASTDRVNFIKMPYSFVGDGSMRESLLSVKIADGSYTNRFVYKSHEFVDGGVPLKNLPCARSAEKTLVVELKDDYAELTLKQCYTVFKDSDVIAVRQELVNNGKNDVSVLRLMSLQLDVSGTSHNCVSFSGAWARERFRKDTVVTAGTWSIQSMGGQSSAILNPFFMLERANGDGVYAFNMIYSGNHKEIVEACNDIDNTRVLVGLNDYCFNWTLGKGETFASPQAVMVFADSEQTVTTQMHDFANKHIVDPEFAYKDRPVLINNWEGTYFNFTEEKLLALADKAAELGVELFVLDDGWFGHRDNDKSSLGDWYDYTEKIKGTLGELADKIRAKGLHFGIWVEPEMISEDSDLYRAHPEYAMTVPGRDPIRRRNQLMLDLVNEEVQDYLIKEIGDVISRCKAYYVKWDCNRHMTDVYSKTLKNIGEYFHRYMLGLYRVISALKERFPAVLFESCSAGGNRFDLGMLYYMPQTWGSDMTEPRHRLSIQEGTLYAYPQSSVGAHVSAWSNSSYESKFNVACLGAFGYELDVTKCTPEELDTMKKQIVFYKKHRHLLQFGKYYRLKSIFGKERKSSWIIVSEDKSEAVAFLAETDELINSVPSKWRFTGLDDNALYSVETRVQVNLKNDVIVNGKARGDALNNCEFCFGNIFGGETDRQACGTPLATRLIYFKKIG